MNMSIKKPGSREILNRRNIVFRKYFKIDVCFRRELRSTSLPSVLCKFAVCVPPVQFILSPVLSEGSSDGENFELKNDMAPPRINAAAEDTISEKLLKAERDFKKSPSKTFFVSGQMFKAEPHNSPRITAYV